LTERINTNPQTQRANPKHRAELLAMKQEDQNLRQKLASDGSLFNHGYHPEMERLHRRNTARLKAIITQIGWPGISAVGQDGEEAAWMIAQHSISDPAFMRLALSLLTKAANRGEAPLWQVAFTEDRIRMFEGRDQLYGSHFDWDDNDELSPFPPIEDPENVEERRAKMGLPPLEAELARKRQESSSEKPPANVNQRRAQMRDWAVSVGWLK
jgi:hypothetical protein